jgi:hypothetical protein
MLTHEQTTIRLRDAEIKRLRDENARLIKKMNDVRLLLVKLIRQFADCLRFSHRADLLKMADDLERD